MGHRNPSGVIQIPKFNAQAPANSLGPPHIMALSLNDKLARNTENLAGAIYKTSFPKSVFTAMIPKEEWTDGISDTQKVLTSERNLPDNIDDWTEITVNAGGNSCAIAGDIIPRGSTERSYSLSQKPIESDRICVNDGRNAYNPQEQIKNTYFNMRQAIAYAWQRRGKLEYTNIAEHKVVATHGLPYDDTAMPGIAATSILTQEILNTYHQFLLLNGAEEDGGSLGMQDGVPQFILCTDAVTSDTLMRAESNAFLYDPKRVPDLLKPLGVNRAFRGFYHTIDLLPRRYTFAGGVYTEVMPYESAAATTGTKQKVSAAYMAAPFTDSVIFLPSVMSFKHPRPISTFGSNTKFDPQTYVGDIQWLNVQNVDPSSAYYNPDNSWGFYRALLASASKPVAPQFGIVIRHLRCPNDIGHTACPTDAENGASSLLGSGDSFFV